MAEGDVAGAGDLDAAGEAEAVRVTVPLVEDVEFLRGGRREVLHALDDFGAASAAGAIEAAGLHVHAGLLAGVEEGDAGIDLGGEVLGKDGNL